MLRLAPSRPPLWRTESSLQLGADAPVRIENIAPWQERLLDALQGGIPDAMLLPLARSLGASQGAAEEFIATIAPALGAGIAAATGVQAELPSEISAAEADALVHGWESAHLEPVRLTRWRQDHPDPALPMIVVADGLVDPRRAAMLIAGGITHLPIHLAGDRAVVGPVVIPGRTGCLGCLHAHRTDADAGWPILAAQLIARRREPTDAAVLLEAAVLSGHLLRSTAAVRVTDGAALSVALSAGSARRRWHVHRPHERCPCRSRQGNETAPAAERPTAATTTTTAFARPA